MAVDTSRDAQLRALAYQAALCRTFFSEYTRFVHGWTARIHQRHAFSALQALADGCLVYPGHTLCPACVTAEAHYIAEFDLPYEPGYRATCGTCPTTNKFLWLAFYASGKSDTLIEYAAWMIGRNIERGTMNKKGLPDAIPQLGWISYADNIAAQRSMAVKRTIAENERYQFIFPHVLPDTKNKWAETEWMIKRSDPGRKDPTFSSAGMGAAILSLRFPTLCVIDDPQDPQQMRSEVYRDDSHSTYVRVISSRTSGERTPMVMIANRWAEDDIPGRIMLSEKGWFILKTPALNEADESVFPQEMHGDIPVGKSTRELHALRESDPVAFATGYMVEPPSSVGDLFTVFTEGDAPSKEKVVRCVQFWDTTTTDKTSSDFNSMTEAWKLANGRTYIHQVLNFKKRPTDTIEVMMAEYGRAEREGLPVVIAIENAHAGPFFVESLRKVPGVRVRNHSLGGFGEKNASRRRGPKDLYSRAVAVVGSIEGGVIYFPKRWAPWKEDAYTQYKSFGAYSKGHDDMVSSLVGAVEYLYPLRNIGRPQPFAHLVRTA